MKPALRFFTLGLALGTAATVLVPRPPAPRTTPSASSHIIQLTASIPASYATRADALRAFVASLPASEFPRLLATFPSDANQDERCQHSGIQRWRFP